MSTLAQECPILFVCPTANPSLSDLLRQTVESVPRLRLAIAASSDAALFELHHCTPAILLLHVTCPGDAAWAGALLQAAAALPEPVGAVVIGEGGQGATGLALLRLGAVEYLERPLDLRRLAMLLDVLTVRARQRLPVAPPAPEVVVDCRPDGSFVYCPSTAMGRIIDQARRVAGVDSNVLILGETGTGKTRLARVIHEMSPRKDQPFLVVNCAALTPTLIESEMFGHVRGSFTGADRDRAGKFADAAGGTLFLDEIDALPVGLQAKLLRVVEDRMFEQVGSNTPVPMRARLITASNKCLEQEVAAGAFREDLFFRLNVVTFEMPPLRERPEAFTSMVGQFVKELAERAGRSIGGVAPDAMAALRAYRWPGNIRELRNAIERAVALREAGPIQLDDLPGTIRVGQPAATEALTDTVEMAPLAAQPKAVTSLAETKANAEAVVIKAALRKNNNNKARTAAELGISRETLYKKLHRYGLFDADL
jgi:two-component system, NtrC family, response regulator AtoC